MASPAGFESGTEHADRSVPRTDRGVKPDATPATRAPNLAMSGGAGDSRRNPAVPVEPPAVAPTAAPASPRAAMLAALSAGMTAALAGGDLDAARVAHEAIGRLLGSPVRGAEVVDLAAERERRAGG